MKAVLIRDGSLYRLASALKAHRHQADVFIRFMPTMPGKSRTARGAWYTRSSAAPPARRRSCWPIKKTPLTDRRCGPNDKDDLVRKVLVDMTQTATIGDSLDLGIDCWPRSRPSAPCIKTVAQAGFMVL